MARTRKGDGQTALVTGASAGIGLDLAECFAIDGYHVILAARTESALRDSSHFPKACGDKITSRPASHEPVSATM